MLGGCWYNNLLLKTMLFEFLKTTLMWRRVFDIKGEELEHSFLTAPSHKLCVPNALKATENTWLFSCV